MILIINYTIFAKAKRMFSRPKKWAQQIRRSMQFATPIDSKIHMFIHNMYACKVSPFPLSCKRAFRVALCFHCVLPADAKKD